MNLVKHYTEQLIWSFGLVALFFMDPVSGGDSFCLFKMAGSNFCPGCGIGHSIHHSLHLNFIDAWEHHKMGVPATILIIWQIIKPFFKNRKLIYGPAIINDAKRDPA